MVGHNYMRAVFLETKGLGLLDPGGDLKTLCCDITAVSAEKTVSRSHS